MLKLKICGLKGPDNIRTIVDLGPDMIGFIFYDSSPRNMSLERKLEGIPDTIQKVGVFVDADPMFVELVSKRFGLNAIQLYHENMVPFQYLRPKLKLIKAISVRSEKDLGQTSYYEEQCDLFLFDTKGERPGGNGLKFDWEILRYYKGKTPFLLSGGIGPGDVTLIKAIDHKKLIGLDINSKFELEPGVKNIRTIQKFKSELYENIEHTK